MERNEATSFAVDACSSDASLHVASCELPEPHRLGECRQDAGRPAGKDACAPQAFGETVRTTRNAQLATDEEAVWLDILAQAVTGELVGMMNYETLAELCDAGEERDEALAHAAIERGHAARFRGLGREIGRDVPSDVDAPYWARIRASFVARAEAGDRTGCFIIQEVMLESFAVASYGRIARVAPGAIGTTFAAVAAQEVEHVEHAIVLLRSERERDPEAFDASVRTLHAEVMSTLALMVAREDRAGHCGLCQGSCVKPSLPSVGLTTDELRGAALRQYMDTLDAIGVPGQAVLEWVTQLPV